MSNWCFICHRKVSENYKWYKREKAHPKCLENYLIKLEKQHNKLRKENQNNTED